MGWSYDMRCGIARCDGVVCIAEGMEIRFGGGTGGHKPLSSTKPDINNNKNNTVVQQCGGVRQRLKWISGARREGWSWVAEAMVLG